MNKHLYKANDTDGMAEKNVSRKYASNILNNNNSSSIYYPTETIYRVT